MIIIINMSDLKDVLITTFASYKARASRKGLKVSITFEDFEELVMKDCYYCGLPSKNGAKHESYDRKQVFRVHGVDRVNNNGGYVKGNVVPCCYLCNSSKSDHDVGAWLRWCMRVAAKAAESSRITPHKENEEQVILDRTIARQRMSSNNARFAAANSKTIKNS